MLWTICYADADGQFLRALFYLILFVYTFYCVCVDN